MFYVYILKSLKNGSFYVGSTNDLTKRLNQHARGGGLYTRKFRPFELVWSGMYNTRAEAVRKERQIKSWKSRKAIEDFIKQC